MKLLCTTATFKPRLVTLSASALTSLAPFTQFARAAYCPTGKIKKLSCGEACQANADFRPTLIGGDGNTIQQFFVGYSPSQKSIIVGHQGTDPTKLEADLTDIDLLMGALDAALFPGTSASIQVHQGFRDEHAKTAHQILAEVKRLMSTKKTNSVAGIGHSLGGALAELDTVFLMLNLPKSASVKGVTYGTPRVGNAAFAKLVDGKVPSFMRVKNKRDIVPIVPWQSLGYLHPHGEVHILSPGNAVVCPGDDDSKDAQCTNQSVPNILEGNVFDHLGPYEGIYIGTAYCT
ncbi:alpha/beta-hydrolase [Gymnopilus junonius]|uniref:Alpha/beta-hydrolase n=1 Tax=Gymnopilus junonius TaxID=109634 RepID=A0A9P5NA28_GYMJU|nr:alpha/beta-hydrolase [Gymnopilus junonius]